MVTLGLRCGITIDSRKSQVVKDKRQNLPFEHNIHDLRSLMARASATVRRVHVHRHVGAYSSQDRSSFCGSLNGAVAGFMPRSM